MNQSLFYYLNNFAGKSEWLDSLIIFSAEYLGWALFVALILWSLVFIKGKSRTKFLTLTLTFSAIAYVVARIIKTLYSAPRPFLELSEMTQLIVHGGYDSFPSGHATFFFAVAMSVFLFLPKQTKFKWMWVSILFIGAFLVSVARVAAGIHWPIDILAGALIGILTVFLAKLACKTKICKNAGNNIE